MNRTSPEYINKLEDNEIFVFGSNLSGRHSKGAAKQALTWGAKWGQAAGLQGKTYGIPTIAAPGIGNKISIARIKPYVDRFIEFAKEHPELTFLVTEVGCGLAYHGAEEMAPLFKESVMIENIHLPKSFWHELLSNQSRGLYE